MKNPCPILLGMVAMASSSHAATPQQRAAEFQKAQVDFAQICSGTGGGELDVRFTDTTDANVVMTRMKGAIMVYREVQPESFDWLLKDMYIFSLAGKRTQFSRSITYAGHLYAYVEVIDVNGKITDNSRALPDPYLSEEPVQPSLRAICRLKPAK